MESPHVGSKDKYLGKALHLFREDLAKTTEKVRQNHQVATLSQVEFVRPGQELFLQIPAESIDYAVIEKCPQFAFQSR